MERNYEEEAQKIGWRPESDWKGESGKWKDAKTFVEHGENYVPFLRKEVKELKADLEMTIKLNKQAASEAEKRGFDAATKSYEKELKSLKEKQVEAVEAGDVDEYKKVESKITDLKKPEEKPEINPVFEEWKDKNEWYQSDEKMARFANFIGNEIASEGLQPDAFYAKVTSQVKETFPEKFENSNRKKVDMVGGGGQTPPKGGKKTFADLPDAAKRNFNSLSRRFEGLGQKANKEDFVKIYFEEE